MHAEAEGVAPLAADAPTASVIIPAHNEEAVIGRLLRTLLGSTVAQNLEIIVVANGCTDGTAAAAVAVVAEFDHPVAARVSVISVPEASKRQALRVGDEHASYFPRVWVDADVVIGGSDVFALCRALESPGVHAAGPLRVLEVTGRPLVVRWYYEVWERLPEVDSGLFGRGVIAMTALGHARVTALPPVMGDDLLASLAFEASERVVVEGATVIVHTPRTVADLVRRRIRTTTSSAHVHQEASPYQLVASAGKDTGARTRPSDLFRMLRAEPQLAPKIAVFLTMAAVARCRSARAVRRGDFTTWLRDESSRTSWNGDTQTSAGSERWSRRWRMAVRAATTSGKANRR